MSRKTKTLVKKMTRDEAEIYLVDSKYRFPTEEELKLYGEQDVHYWSDDSIIDLDSEFPMFRGRRMTILKDENGLIKAIKQTVSEHHTASVLCIKDIKNNDLLINQILDNFKLGKVNKVDTMLLLKEV